MMSVRLQLSIVRAVYEVDLIAFYLNVKTMLITYNLLIFQRQSFIVVVSFVLFDISTV